MAETTPQGPPALPSYSVGDLVRCAICFGERAPSSFVRHGKDCEQNLAKRMDSDAAKAYADKVSASLPTQRVSHRTAPHLVVLL